MASQNGLCNLQMWFQSYPRWLYSRENSQNVLHHAPYYCWAITCSVAQGSSLEVMASQTVSWYARTHPEYAAQASSIPRQFKAPTEFLSGWPSVYTKDSLQPKYMDSGCHHQSNRPPYITCSVWLCCLLSCWHDPQEIPFIFTTHITFHIYHTPLHFSKTFTFFPVSGRMTFLQCLTVHNPLLQAYSWLLWFYDRDLITL